MGELPDLAAIVDAITQPPLPALVGSPPASTSSRNDARVHQGFSTMGVPAREFVARLLAAKPMMRSTRPVVPAAIEMTISPPLADGDVALE